MAKKKKVTSKIKKVNSLYTKRLPKAADGLDLTQQQYNQTANSGLGYLEQNSQMFTPNSDQFQSLSANTQANNPNSFGNQGGIGNTNSANNAPTDSNSGSSFNAGTVSDALGYAGAAVNLIGDMEGGLTRQETQETVDMLGNTIGGAYYSGGKAVDEMLFAKDAETGLQDNALEASLSYAITDPSQMISQAGSSFESFLDGSDKTGLLKGFQEISLPGVAGYNAYNEQEAANKIQANNLAMAKNQFDLSNFNQRNPKQQYEGVYGKYGGYLPKKATGGNLEGPESPNMVNTPEMPNTDKLELFRSTDPLVYDFGKTDNILRQQNLLNTQYNVERDFNINKQDFYQGYRNRSGYLDSLVMESRNKYSEGTMPYQYTKGVDNDGNEVLDLLIPDKRTTTTEQRIISKQKFGGDIGSNNGNNPIIRKYKGETHDNGSNGGIEVDKNGNPTSVTGKEGIALVENGEVAHNGYIFSNSIEYK